MVNILILWNVVKINLGNKFQSGKRRKKRTKLRIKEKIKIEYNKKKKVGDKTKVVELSPS